MVRERPILFSGPMVRAILAGTKTQTRRVVKPSPSLDPRSHDYAVRAVVGHADKTEWSDVDGFGVSFYGDRGLSRHQRCRHGQPGDRLWVRETHLPDPPIDGTWPSTGDTYASIEDIPERYRSAEHVLYRATWKDGGCGLRWRPSIYMPRWASRITLEITDVRVERLQDITEADAEAEGMPHPSAFREQPVPVFFGGDFKDAETHRDVFAAGWDSIKGERAPWASNPWVWVLTFRRPA
jgi:hypothetical protein